MERNISSGGLEGMDRLGDRGRLDGSVPGFPD
jgi:hypothetical protein